MWSDVAILAGKILEVPGTLGLFVPVYKTIKIQSLISGWASDVKDKKNRDLLYQLVDRSLAFSIQMSPLDTKLAIGGVGLIVAGSVLEVAGLVANLV